jgi:hypothetical protein
MARYTTADRVRGEIPDPPASLTDTLVNQYIEDHSAIVRNKLRNLPDSVFSDYPSIDPLIERIVRFYAAYDAMVFIELEQRRYEDGVPVTLIERADAMLADIATGAYQIADTAPRRIAMAKSAGDRLVTLTNQGYEGGCDDPAD